MSAGCDAVTAAGRCGATVHLQGPYRGRELCRNHLLWWTRAGEPGASIPARVVTPGSTT